MSTYLNHIKFIGSSKCLITDRLCLVKQSKFKLKEGIKRKMNIKYHINISLKLFKKSIFLVNIVIAFPYFYIHKSGSPSVCVFLCVCNLSVKKKSTKPLPDILRLND